MNSHGTPAGMGDRTAADQSAGLTTLLLGRSSLKLGRMRNTIPHPAFFKTHLHTDYP